MNSFGILLLRILFFSLPSDDRKKEIWAGRHQCPRCRRVTDFHLTKTEKTFYSIFIPVMKMTDDRFIACDECGYEKKLRIYQYNKIKKSRFEDIKNSTFPAEMVCKDFSPQELKYKSRIAKVIITAVLFIAMLLIALINSNEFAKPAGIYLFIIFVCLPFAVPFMLSVKGLMPYLKKADAYEHMREFPSMHNAHSPIDFHIHGADKILTEPSYQEIYSVMDGAGNPPLTDNAPDFDTATTKTIPEPLPDACKEKNTSPLKKWIYFLLGKIGIIQKRYQNNPDFEVAFHKLSGNKVKSFYMIHLILLCIALISVVVWLTNIGTSDITDSVIILFTMSLLVSIIFLIVAVSVSPGIAHSLKTLADTGNIKYIDEVLPYIGHAGEKVVFQKHLLYDKPTRVIVAYDDIISGYPLFDSNNYIHYTVLCTVDGRKHKTTITDELLYEFKLRKPYVIWETTELRR